LEELESNQGEMEPKSDRRNCNRTMGDLSGGDVSGTDSVHSNKSERERNHHPWMMRKMENIMKQ